MKEQFDGNDPFKEVDLDNDIGADKIKAFYDDELFCKIKGSIFVTKVTGQLTFRLKGEKQAFQKYFGDSNNNDA